MESAGVECDGVWRTTTAALDMMESASVECTEAWRTTSGAPKCGTQVVEQNVKFT